MLMLFDACHPDRPLIFCPAVRQIISQPATKIRDPGATKDQNMGLRLLMHLEIIFSWYSEGEMDRFHREGTS